MAEDFGSPVNPISPPRFSDLAPSLILVEYIKALLWKTCQGNKRN